MRDVGYVTGSAEQAKELIIGVTTVYVHSEITPLDGEYEGLYKYREIQYTKDEYIKLMADKNADLETQLTNTQLALCELYEAM